jgi:solute carrier family 25 (mitochondrial adenine nucleotide translocator), member 4/5/6/31
MQQFLTDLVLGGGSGVLAKTLCAPMERVKIILQTQAASNLSKDEAYKGIVDAFVRIPKEQGFAAFWRGNFTNCARYFPTQAMNFAFKEKYQKLFVRPKEEVGFARYFLGYLAAGGAAGATSLLVAYPLDFAYTRLAADTGKEGAREFTGLGNCLTTIFKKEGPIGLYRGFAPSVAGIIVYRAGYFGFYDFAKTLLFKEHSYSSVPLKFALALTVDIASAMLSYPFDTVRRRMMMQAGKAHKQYTGSIQCLKHIVAQEGVNGLYKGAGMNSVRAIASALVLVFYDEFKHLAGVKAGGKGH